MPNNNEFLQRLQHLLAEDPTANWTATETTVSGLSQEDFKRRLGCLPPAGVTAEEIIEHSRAQREAPPRAPVPGIPPAHDWRKVEGRIFISSIKDQGNCGSCVAFGVAATLEGTARVCLNIAVNDPYGNILEDLSEAQLFFCGGAGDCDKGWWIGDAMQYVVDTGVVPSSRCPYKDITQPCNLPTGWEKTVTQLAAYHWIKYDDKSASREAVKAWLSKNGPVATAFAVAEDFQFYKGGVYRYVDGKFLGLHCVSIVGYDDNDDNGQGAWTCKNSWGPAWGEKGYFRIGYGEAGIDWMCPHVPDGYSRIYVGEKIGAGEELGISP